jgi:hypothetical protein
MSKRLFVFLFLICLGSSTAQKFSGKISPFHKSSTTVFNKDTLKILAVLVEFQVGRDASTFGNGKFGTMYSQNYGNSILDPMPHNQQYFQSHLEFTKNYFSKVSNGKLNVVYTVLPDTITVSKTIRDYSPADNSSDFTGLGNLSSEVWTLADQNHPGFNFGDYDLFVIFHAGVGRDITLPGSLGNEKDLPSVFMGQNTLQKIFGSTFQGFPVSGGSFNINNSMIIPETENRELSSFGQTVLFQITINGLLVSSIASYLGLPDLFDTNTGLSAIGRFGLMDGQAIFSYAGLFPPEPSAWEKIYLGWVKPVTVSPGNYNLNMTALRASSPGDTTILKIPINSSEYFLVENRQRDAHNDGAILTINSAGQTITKKFTQDASGFYSYAVDSVYGVVTDVDEFDWSLPGQIDDTSHYAGGILIWHIDNNVINAKIAADQINNDNTDRGVELVEANGIKEIGYQFTTITGDLVTGEGSYEDYYFKNNTGALYTNVFDKNSRPNSNAHSGANSLISMSGFPLSSNKMNFNLAYGDSVIKPLFSSVIPVPPSGIVLTAAGNDIHGIFFMSGSDLFLTNKSGIYVTSIAGFSNYKPASFVLNNTDYVFGVKDSLIKIFSFDGTVSKLDTVNTGKLLSCSPILNINNMSLTVGSFNGTVLIYKFDPQSAGIINLQSTINSDNNNFVKALAVSDDYYSVLRLYNDKNVIIDNLAKSYTVPEVVLQLSVTKNRAGNYVNIALTDNSIYLISDGNLLKIIHLPPYVTSFSVADLKNDGENYIVYNSGSQIHAINLAGAEAVNFPFTDPDGRSLTGSPLCADFEGDKKSEIISFTDDGRIVALDGGTGKYVSGFPISSGLFVESASIFDDNGKISLAVIDSGKHFYGWNIGSTSGTYFWTETNGSSLNNSFVSSAAASNYVNEFFPKNKVYNYPNPVYNGVTAIRYYVSENSKINIKIFDIAGDFVAELNNNAQGGFESETLWNVNNIQSGVYLARVQAVGESGKTENNVIKIAVVK